MVNIFEQRNLVMKKIGIQKNHKLKKNLMEKVLVMKCFCLEQKKIIKKNIIKKI